MGVRKRSNMTSIGERGNIQIIAQGSDVWHGTLTSTSVPPSSGEQMEIFCANGEDTAGGTGVQEVEIHYLDVNGVEKSEITATNGGAKDTVASDMMFIQDIHSTKVGSNGVAVDDITIRSKATPANVYNMILLGGNMSLSISKMVPAGKTLYITHWDASASGKQAVTVRLRSTDHHGVLYNSGNPVFLFKDTVNLENSSFVRRWVEEEWFPIPELSIIKVSVWCPDQAGADVSAGWTGVLIDNEPS